MRTKPRKIRKAPGINWRAEVYSLATALSRYGWRPYMSDNKQGVGIDRRGMLECMIWAETGVIWTLGGGVPKSSQLDKA
jgi:hypothetical protein